MDRKLKAARIKKVVEQQTQIRTATNPHLLHIAEFETDALKNTECGSDCECGKDDNGELYEGVTDKTTVDSSADYRMITRSEDVSNSQSS